MAVNDYNMDQTSPLRHPAAVQHVTPECNSRLSLISTVGEDSGYASIPSASMSSSMFSIKDGSVSPVDARKRLFDSSNLSFTPEVSSNPRKTRVSGRNLPGRRCLLSSVSLREENQEDVVPSENRNAWPGYTTPTKLRPNLSSKSTISPTKPHPYFVRDASGNLCKSPKVAATQNSRTPPRTNRPRLPTVKLPSFSDPSGFRDPFRPREGSHYVDFFWCLGEERVMAPALSLVLSYLSDKDLMACCLVSRTWLMMVTNDKAANGRRLEAVRKLRLKKENLIRASLKDKIDINKGNRSILSSIQNIQLLPPENVFLKTPPPKTSPRKLRFELFMKEGLRLESNEVQHLKPCPRCSLPSLVDTRLNLGVCTRLSCQFRFCTLCHCLEHIAPINASPCTPSSSPPRYITCPFAPRPRTPPSPPQPIVSSTRSRISLVGSKRSRRNLRRL